MKKHLPTIILILVFIGGLSLLLYPTVSDWWNSMHQSRAIASYTESVANLKQDEYDKMLNDAREFNKLVAKRGGLWKMSSDEKELYYSQLDVENAGGIIAYIEINKINCTLPIYKGTGDEVLQVAIGHVEASSLPIGGESTHCVLSGHRGLPSAKLFTNLDKMAEGDTFILRTLNETLTYQVDKISIVLPGDTSLLKVVQGEDLCTLVTCTPYGVNTHRLLVRGHRIENAEEAIGAEVTAEALLVDPMIVAPIVAVPMLLALFIWLLTSSSKRNATKRKLKKERKMQLMEEKKQSLQVLKEQRQTQNLQKVRRQAQHLQRSANKKKKIDIERKEGSKADDSSDD